MTTEERLLALESRYRKLLALTGLLSAILFVALVAGAKAQDARNLRVQSLELVDGKGKVRALLGGPFASSKISLVLLDENGNDRLSLSADKDGSGIYLSDDSKKLRASLSTYKGIERKDPSLGTVSLGEGAFLELRDKKGDARAGIEVSDDTPWVTLKDEKGKPRATLGAARSIGAVLNLSGEKGWIDFHVRPGVEKDAEPKLQIRDEKGNPVWSAP